MTSTELQHALAIEACDPTIDEENLSEVDTIISVCAGLVTIEKESNTVRLVHHTTQEYLEQNCSSWISNCQTDIATACLRYISSETFAIDLSSDREEYEAMISKNIFLDYAAHCWGLHVKDASDDSLKSSSLSVLESESKIACLGQVIMSQYDDFHAQPLVLAVHLVVYFKLNDLLPILLNKGHSPDSKDMRGQTPLHWAAAYGNQEAVEFLIEQHDVEVDQRDDMGCSSLLRAVMNKQEKIVKLLLKRGDVDVNLMDIDNWTPLHFAVSGDHEGCVRLLLERSDIDVNLMSKNDWNPLYMAVCRGCEGCVRLVLERSDVDVNLMNKDNWTPLLFAVYHGYEGCVRLVLERSDVDVNLMNKDNWTPLLFAVYLGYEGCVRLLFVELLGG